MKTIFISTFIILTCILRLHAQPSLEKIEIKKGFPNYGFKYGDIYLNIHQLGSVLKKNEQAYKLLKPAKVNYDLVYVFSCVGVAGILSPLQLLIPPLPNEERNNKYVWPFVGIGIGALAISIPLRIKANKQALEAVALYNSGLGSNLNQPRQYEFKLAVTNNGVGLTCHF